MIPKTVSYFDYNGDKQSETFWFHLPRKAAIKDISIADQIDTIQRIMSAPKHELTTGEKQLILDFLQKIIRMSYGIRSEDGRKFKQNDEVWEDFEETAAYDEFLTSLFTPDPAAAFQFLLDVVPQNLRAEIEAEAAKQEIPAVTPAPQPAEQNKMETSEDAERAAFLQWKQSQGGKLEL